ncbi:tyrosine-type recombinase/integrase [Bryocella elongata]|uniref:tyrosine-type recombinase/integrase n=1 Tax=Bryocella elongata TaxID=863522 RepID=UPI001357A5EC|nr:site-specific integrase [Bryocella elongata]
MSFFAYAHSVEGANTVNEITPSMVTRYIASERRRERSADNAIGFLSTFYRYLMAEDDSMMLRNPVISRLHYEKRPQRLPRPYTDEQLSGIRDLIEGSGRLELMLAAAIGEECGLRIGEVANIRVVDVDTLRQTIHVRLPTKNLEERDVPYHDRVALHMSRWLERRLPCGEDDHLLLSLRGRPYSNSTLCMQFHNLFLRQDSPAHGFSFHRLRHTWATKLMNNGLELSVLKLLGGWKDLTSMQRYIQVMPETIQRQYQEAFQKLSARPQERIAPVISLNEYARRRAA